jgi:membrane-associated phospholipid phosphatase
MSVRRRYAVRLLVAYAIWLVAFYAVGLQASKLPALDLTTAWDRAIPVVPAFVWPYELCYIFPFSSLLVVRDWRRFDAALLASALASASAFVVYLALPIAFPRPPLGDGLAERVLALEYAADFSPGANNLPSLHVALSWIMGRAMLGQRSRIADVAVVTVVLAITLSTLFVKQHLLIDVAAGIVWALAAWAVARRLLRSRRDDEHVREGGPVPTRLDSAA